MRRRPSLATILFSLMTLGHPLLAQSSQPPGGSGSDPAQSSSSRADWWLQKKQEKMERSAEPEVSLIERAALWAEDKGLAGNKEDEGGAGFSVDFGTITSGSGLALGGKYTVPTLAGSPLGASAGAVFSYRGYELYQFQFGKLPHRKNLFSLEPPDRKPSRMLEADETKEAGLALYADIRYRHYPRHDFFGIGQGSVPTGRSDYLLRGSSFDGVLEYQINRWVGLAARSGLIRFEVGPGTDERFPNSLDLYPAISVPGLAGTPDFLHLDTAVLIDYRDEPGDPSRGGSIGLLASRFDDRGGGRLNFNRFSLDARHYLPLWAETRVLALRLFVSSNDPDGGSEVPFFLQSWLGGSDTLRGYDSFRFTDHDAIHLSTEYRWEAHPALELALFLDAGKVFRGYGNLDFNNLKTSYGTGIRIKKADSILVRFDIARSPEDTRFIVSTGAAF